MSSKKVLVDQIGEVARIQLNDPATLNAITAEMVDQLDEAFERSAASCRAAVLTSAGRAFSSGANLAGGQSVNDPDGQLDLGLFLEQHINPLIEKLMDLPIPWISAVRGAAAGVGCSLALAADLVIASDTAFFLQAFSRVGLVPDGGAAWLLMRAIGRPRAMELMLLGENLEAPRALEWGLINRMVPDTELDTAALQLASALARGPTKAFSLIRQLGQHAADGDLRDLLAAERVAQRTAGQTRDAMEGIAAFLGKRTATFAGN